MATMTRVFWLCALLLIAPLGRVHAQAPLARDEAIADFPERITFEAEYAGDQPLTAATLRFDVEKFSCVEVVGEIDVPVDGDTLRYDWILTRAGNVPPGTTVWWEWVLTDATGVTWTTPRETITFTDDRFAWREAAAEGVTVHWYQGDVGAPLLDAAVDGLHTLEAEMGIELQQPVDIFVYGDSATMREALLYVQGWAGGVAFNEYNTILLGVAPSQVDDWGVRVVAHELAHLVVGQFGRSCVGGSRPTWLDEGLAMVAEGEPAVETQVDLAAGEFEPLRSLNGTFPAHFGSAQAAYSQSYSVVDYLLETYGGELMQQLITVLAHGENYDDALEQVYGLNTDELENAWRAAIGVPARTIPPTPTPLTAAAVPTIAPLNVARVVPTPATLAPPDVAEAAPPVATWILCAGVAVLIPLLAAGTIALRQRRQRA